MFNKDIAGQRVLIRNKDMWFEDIFELLSKNFDPYTRKLPDYKCPKWMLSIYYIFSKREKNFLPLYGKAIEHSN